MFSVRAKPVPSQCQTSHSQVFVSWFPESSDPAGKLIIHFHPVDVCKCLAVHFVDEQAALQVVHLVLDDTGCPSARLPRHLLPSGVQPCKVIYSLGKNMLNCVVFNLTFPCPWLFLFLFMATGEGNVDSNPDPSQKRCFNFAHSGQSIQAGSNADRLLGLLWG